MRKRETDRGRDIQGERVTGDGKRRERARAERVSMKKKWRETDNKRE